MSDVPNRKKYLINHVVAQEDLLDLAYKIGGKIMKDVNGFIAEIEEFRNCFGTEDFVEGTQAFLEKRKAEFPGR